MPEAARLITTVETKGVRRATDELSKFGNAANDADSGVVSLTDAVKKAAPVVKAVAVGVSTATAALTAMAVKTAGAEKEWQNLATVAASTTAEFKAAAFAADQYNISAEKLSDISKDVNEKLGEFIATGGGGFKDFFDEVAPQVGITAQELQNLSGPQVLQRVKNAMDQANVSMEEQSFFLESIASDTTLLIPLLSNHGAEMDRLASAYARANDELRLSSDQQAGLRELSATFGLFTDQAGNAAGILSATLAPTLDSFFNDVIDVVPTATAALADFFNIFIATENLATIKATEERLKEINDEIEEIRGSGRRAQTRQKTKLQNLKEEAEVARSRIDELRKAAQQLEAQTFEGGRIGAVGGTFTSQSAANDEIDRQADLLQRKRDLANEYRMAELEAQADFEAAMATQEAQAQSARVAATQGVFWNLAALSRTENRKLFQIGKAAALAQATVSTAQAVTNALAVQPYPLGVALAGSAAIAGGVQIAAIQNSAGNFEKGGIVGGTSFTGDNITANVNSGEMILNRAQQRQLFDQANGRGGAGANIVINNMVSNDTSVSASQDDEGRISILVERSMANQISQPNSTFNKAFNRSRRAPRVF